MAERIVSFVMSGGVGSRLWPLSREDNPKQFHDLSGDGSMLVKTLRRLKARPDGETPIYLIAAETPRRPRALRHRLAGSERLRASSSRRTQHRRGGGGRDAEEHLGPRRRRAGPGGPVRP